MVKQYKVGFVYNVDRTGGLEDAEFDSPETLMGIKNAIEDGGHEIICIEADQQIYNNLYGLKDKIDIIFNIAEGFFGDSRESIFPIFFELLGIPYTGSGPETLSLGLNKDAAKKVWISHKIPTPRFQTFTKIEELKDFNLNFPVIIKPVHEGTSKGITNDSYVENFQDLEQKVKFIIKTYKQEADVEEFVNGREFTVGVLGNDPYIILPPVEIDFSYLPPHIHHFSSYEVKTTYDKPDSTVCPANITPNEEKKLQKVALEAYKKLNCRDFGRCDMRMDNKGKVYVIEINPLAGISFDPEVNHSFPKGAMTYGFTYSEMINEILNNALKRYGMYKD
ncbi:MAG: D-alanine--D-alanine ligase [Promethearchaeota archaeon]